MAAPMKANHSLDAMMHAFVDASGENVENIIKALKKLPQRMEHKAKEEKLKAKQGLNTTGSVKKAGTSKGINKTGGMKRPLNAFMCWRKFYNPMLTPHTQKAKSKILSVLWKADPFHGKWALLAKVYSDVRGNLEKSEVPLDEYLVLCTPLVGVLNPDIYMDTMGWILSASEGQGEVNIPKATRVFVPGIETFGEYYTTTNYSADDLVKHCIGQDLVKVAAGSPKNAQNGAMTMAVRPSTASAADNEVSEVIDTNAAVAEDVTSASASELDPLQFLSAGEVTLNAAAAFFDAGYPYATAFDPTSDCNITFDPAVEDPTVADGGIFDTFDMAGAFATNQQTDGDQPEQKHSPSRRLMQ